ncbi:hypothetical protein LSTR_LSTR010859 [Laodelphax striatellus]|uniref:Uncharacterized protein n=1 Tax=Laodelphax striatellus TaxID=195883 RepID=A0A482WP91_LAOST|nr:hypothetical protein LSTR_LSTR010859 [Laodelphax striatellus]
MLLPPLHERIALLDSLLSQEDSLTKGQRMLLNVIVKSLEDHQTLASLLSDDLCDCSDALENSLIESLMKTLLLNRTKHTMLQLSHLTQSASPEVHNEDAPAECTSSLHRLLYSLHCHLLSHCARCMEGELATPSCVLLLSRHVTLMLSHDWMNIK